MAKLPGQTAVVIVEDRNMGRFARPSASAAVFLAADEPVASGGADAGPGPLRAISWRGLTLHGDDLAAVPGKRILASPQFRGLTEKHDKIQPPGLHGLRKPRESKIDWHQPQMVLEGPLDTAQRQRLLRDHDKMSRPPHADVGDQCEPVLG